MYPNLWLWTYLLFKFLSNVCRTVFASASLSLHVTYIPNCFHPRPHVHLQYHPTSHLFIQVFPSLCFGSLPAAFLRSAGRFSLARLLQAGRRRRWLLWRLSKTLNSPSPWRYALGLWQVAVFPSRALVHANWREVTTVKQQRKFS